MSKFNSTKTSFFLCTMGKRGRFIKLKCYERLYIIYIALLSTVSIGKILIFHYCLQGNARFTVSFTPTEACDHVVNVSFNKVRILFCFY